MKAIFLLILCFFNIFIYAQNKEQEKKSVRIKIVWLPVLASSPANGFMYGVAPSSNWLMGDESNTSYSNALGSIVFTTKSQFLFTFKGTMFFSGNKSLIMQDIRYFKTSQPTFGLGTGPSTSKLASNGFEYEDGNYSTGIDEGQMMKFNFLRIHETYLKRIDKRGLYAGIGYHLDIHQKIEDQLLVLDTVPPVITSSYAYAVKNGFNPKKYTLSGLSANILYDTRDNTVSPYKGMYGLVTFKFNPEFLGSDKNSSTLWAEYRTYFSLKKDRPKNLLAFWAYGNFELGGTLPYLDLPALGWDQFGRSGRGYPQGRFRGQEILYSEVEWRFPLQKTKEKWGAVLFLNANSATNNDAGIGMFKYINTGYGAGVRFSLNEKSRTNLCLDYGFGNYGAHGFYLSVNEVF
ncbi:MAG: BamA/TamA family outer membrane protein [Aequorivita sp.]|nr:BamA/TamA family outer membrane protein [Aequorivita sp.]MCB0467042.1 BamA/TamA family outer membrane protein [Aequorivita sp.]